MNDNTARTYGTIDEEIPTRPAGDLPSIRTQGYLYDEALESDDIEQVKAVLVHVWLHYQAQEFMLANRDKNAATITAGLKQAEEAGFDPGEVVARGMAGALIDTAYELAHQASSLGQILGTDPAQLLRTAFDLDFDEATTQEDDAIVDVDGASEGQVD